MSLAAILAAAVVFITASRIAKSFALADASTAIYGPVDLSMMILLEARITSWHKIRCALATLDDDPRRRADHSERHGRQPRDMTVTPHNFVLDEGLIAVRHG